MSDNSALLVMNNSAPIKAITSSIYQTLVSIQQQHPEWISAKYRGIPWHHPKYQSALTDKLTKGLNHVITQDDLMRKVRNYLQIILTREFINSLQYNALITEINQLIYSEIRVVSSDHELDSQIANSATNGTKLVEPGIAILLLDVENLQLDAETEKKLVDICTYPIQIKVAFANWRSMGKKDEELHQRGYELIHVPPGKDSADLKMATVGASIFVHYPTAKEVLVCSSDRGLTHLGTTLQSHGLTVYQVRKYKNQITVLNSKTGESHIYALLVPEIPSLEQFIIHLQELIQAEMAKTGMQWIKFSRLSALYKETYKLTIKDVITHYFPGQESKQIFINYPAYFAIHQPSNKSPTYISIFNLFKSDKKNSNSANIVDISEITSPEIMEKILVNIVHDLTAESPGSYLPISNLSSEFNRLYSQPITKTLKRFQPSKKFPKFLESCSLLKLYKSEEGRWFVGLV